MTHVSQRLQVLRHLAKGKSITPLQAFLRFNCLTLSQRIGELKREGWRIHSKLVNVDGKHVARYSIPSASR